MVVGAYSTILALDQNAPRVNCLTHSPFRSPGTTRVVPERFLGNRRCQHRFSAPTLAVCDLRSKGSTFFADWAGLTQAGLDEASVPAPKLL